MNFSINIQKDVICLLVKVAVAVIVVVLVVVP